MRGNYQYFVPAPETAEELKKKYRELVFKHHPDQGGNTEDMKKVNAEHKKLFAKVGHIHTNSKGERYEKAPNETAEQFVEIMNTLIRFERVLIEICGTFIWVSGDTKPYKEQLKEMGFRWSANKLNWYLAPKDFRKRSQRDFSMSDIRDMFGSETVENKPFKKLATQ